MKRLATFSLFAVLLSLSLFLSSCGRGAIRQRTIWASDHNVTVVKKPASKGVFGRKKAFHPTHRAGVHGRTKAVTSRRFNHPIR